MQYDIKRLGTTLLSVRPESGSQKKELMLTDLVSMSFTLPAAIKFEHGDYVDVWGERYNLNQLAEPEKLSSVKHKYSLTFQAGWYDLAKPLFFFYDSANALWLLSEFELMCTAEMALDLVLANANREQTGWIKGTVAPTATKRLSFTGQETVLQALTQIAQEFETEWHIQGKTIHLTKQGNDTGYHFAYGRDKGLRGGLKRTNVDATGAFSRLYVRGSSQNLPFNYRGGQNRLMLPAPLQYIQGVKYGKDEIERPVTFEDIRPERIGTVTAVVNKFAFADAAINFDINEQLIAGTSAKITFNTGQCAGYTFEIAKGGYNHAAKTITLLPVDDEKAIDMPSDLLKPAIGDEYVLFDIYAHESDVLDAEQRLKAKGDEYFALNAPPKVSYSIPPDEFYFERNDIVFEIGDTVNVKDLDIGIDKGIRVTAYERDLHNKYKYLSPIVVSDIVKGTVISAQYNAAEKLDKAIQANKVNDIRRAKMNWKTTSELTTLIETIRAEMLLITMDGGAYTSNIECTVIADAVSTTAGRIVHNQYSQGNGIWDVAALAATALPDDKPYFLYIKAGRNTGTAIMQLSESKIAVESDPAYYFFPFGVVSSVMDGDRQFTSLRGYTRVTGDTIGLGRIVANNTNDYWDLNSSKFNVGDADNGMDFNVSKSGELTVRGAVMAKTLKVGDGATVNAGISGVTDAGPNSIRQWAGADEAHKHDAPYRVYDNGKVVMTQADISGLINAVIGKIANFTIDANGLKNTDNSKDAYVIQMHTDGSGNIIAKAAIGTDIDNGDNKVGDFINWFNNFAGPNYGMRISVKNGSNSGLASAFSGNFALDIDGDIWQRSGNMIIGDKLFIKNGSGFSEGITNEDIQYDYGGGTYRLKVKNGIIIGQEHI